MRQISSDPFARTTLHSEFVHVPTYGGAMECSWCGGKNKRGGLFKYSQQADGSRAANFTIRGLFCSIGCMRAYHG